MHALAAARRAHAAIIKAAAEGEVTLSEAAASRK
jgi:hypothetical protein